MVGNGACAIPPVPVSAVSTKRHGAAGTFDIDLPLTGNPGIECRSGGASGNHRIVITFPAPVTISSAAVSSGSGSVASSTVSGNVVTVDLTAVGNAQTIAITLSGVTMGSNRGDVVIRLGVLAGDTNADRFVDSADIAQTKSQSGNALTSAHFREDVNVDGFMDSADIGLVKSKSGTALP